MENSYNQLALLIEQMICDGVQLVHGGEIIDWEDTRIPELLSRIKDEASNTSLPNISNN